MGVAVAVAEPIRCIVGARIGGRAACGDAGISSGLASSDGTGIPRKWASSPLAESTPVALVRSDPLRRTKPSPSRCPVLAYRERRTTRACFAVTAENSARVLFASATAGIVEFVPGGG